MLSLPLTGALRFAGLVLDGLGASLSFDCQWSWSNTLSIYRQSTGISYSVVLAA